MVIATIIAVSLNSDTDHKMTHATRATRASQRTHEINKNRVTYNNTKRNSQKKLPK